MIDLIMHNKGGDYSLTKNAWQVTYDGMRSYGTWGSGIKFPLMESCSMPASQDFKGGDAEQKSSIQSFRIERSVRF